MPFGRPCALARTPARTRKHCGCLSGPKESDNLPPKAAALPTAPIALHFITFCLIRVNICNDIQATAPPLLISARVLLPPLSPDPRFSASDNLQRALSSASDLLNDRHTRFISQVKSAPFWPLSASPLSSPGRCCVASFLARVHAAQPNRRRLSWEPEKTAVKSRRFRQWPQQLLAMKRPLSTK